MSEAEIAQPRNWAASKGYANGLLATGRQLFIAGRIGSNAKAAGRNVLF